MNPTSYGHVDMSRVHEGLAGVDLNLLVAFEALVSERNVTRAARHMGVTQSAMSHTLKRLRATFDDELLVRTSGGMALTPRADALIPQVRDGLALLRRALSGPQPFDLASSERTFHMSGPDLFQLLFMPALLERMGAAAGRVGISVVHTPPDRVAEALERGDLDIAITNRMLDGGEHEPGPGLMRRTLLEDGWRCFLRERHPLLSRPRRKLSMAEFVRWPHVMVSPGGRGPGLVDEALAREGRARRVALRVPSFYAAPVAAAASDLILTAPAALMRVVGHLQLMPLEPPVKLPRHSVDMTWHRRFNDDPGHRWLRQAMVDSVGGRQGTAT